MPFIQEISMQVHDFSHVNSLTGGSVTAHVLRVKCMHIYTQDQGLKQHWRERRKKSSVGIPEQQCTVRVCERCLPTWATVIFPAMFPLLRKQLTISLGPAAPLGKHFKVWLLYRECSGVENKIPKMLLKFFFFFKLTKKLVMQMSFGDCCLCLWLSQPCPDSLSCTCREHPRGLHRKPQHMCFFAFLLASHFCCSSKIVTSKHQELWSLSGVIYQQCSTEIFWTVTLKYLYLAAI